MVPRQLCPQSRRQPGLLNRDRLHPLGAWYHVAAVYDGREFRNYVNGVQEGAAEIRFTPQRPGRSSVGVRFNKVNYFKGAIRAARFTRRALTPAEFLAVGQPTPTGTGATAFASRCASCHGTDGNGGELGPPITGRVASRTDEELRAVIRQGLTGAGMPAFSTLSDTETSDLVQHLRSLRARSGSGPTRAEIALAGGGAIAGLVLNRGPPICSFLATIGSCICSARAAARIAASRRRQTGQPTTGSRAAAATVR
jgi:mono/diheme cytochrome c family protein